jgi:iron(III) transport system substrate-binding protein
MQSAQPAGEVNIYSHRHYDSDKQLFSRFTATTGIKVNVVQADADQLMQRLETEGRNSPADILITVDAGRLNLAKEKGLLQGVRSAKLDANVPTPLRDTDGQWFGLTQRARVIMYAKDRVKPADLSSYEALANPRWKGKILVRSSSNVYNQSMMAAMIAHKGAAAAAEWAKGIAANLARPPRGGDRDQILAVAAGEGDIAISNTYYLGLLLNSENANERKLAANIGVFFPNQGDRGTHVNVSGAGVTAHAKNKENAIRLLEFLTSAEAQSVFAEANYEFPVLKGVQPAALLRSWGQYKADQLNLSLLGKHNREAVKLMDQAGWR